jgi:hypothetical protein
MVIFIIATVSVTLCLARWHILESGKAWVICVIPSRFSKVEELIGTLMYCPQCIGFWIGMALYFLIPVNWTQVCVLNVVISGMVSSCFSMLFDTVLKESKDE